MKKLLSILVLSLLFSGSAFGEIYKCKLNDNHTFVIKTENSEEQVLATVDPESGKFTDDSKIYTFGVTRGEIIEFRGKTSSTHEIMVLSNPDKKSSMSFRGIYFDSPTGNYFTSIKIDYWDKDHPIYFYDDWNNRIRRGTCD